MYQKLISNKFFLTAAIISGLILLLVVLISPKHTTTNTPSPTPISQLRTQLSNLSEEKKTAAIKYYDLVSDSFPFFFADFNTSAGITTTIHIYHSLEDPLEITHFEIYGLSYMNKNELDESKNPNVTAYKESFQKGLQLLREADIDPKQLIFVYGDRDYVQSTATYWVDKLGLLR